MAVQRKCGTCRWLRVPAGKKPYHGHAYKCMWVMPAIVWPDSIREGFNMPAVHPAHMQPGDGVTCPQWEETPPPTPAGRDGG